MPLNRQHRQHRLHTYINTSSVLAARYVAHLHWPGPFPATMHPNDRSEGMCHWTKIQGKAEIDSDIWTTNLREHQSNSSIA